MIFNIETRAENKNNMPLSLLWASARMVRGIDCTGTAFMKDGTYIAWIDLIWNWCFLSFIPVIRNNVYIEKRGNNI